MKAILLSANGYDCDVLNEWAKGFHDRDGKFVKEFQTSFNSSFWELYLWAILKHFHCDVDFSYSRPDFHVTSNGKFNIEAVIASHSANSKPEWSNENKRVPEDLNEFNQTHILRLSNAIVSKYRKYKTQYSELDHVKGLPFVIAVTSYAGQLFKIQCQRPIEAVLFDYYVDEETYLSGKNPAATLDGKPINYVKKESGATVDMGIFNSDRYREISAIIFSSCATIGKVKCLSSDPNFPFKFCALRYNSKSEIPHKIEASKNQYVESLVDGLRVYHNPYATYKLPTSIFRHKDVFQTYLNENTGEWIYENRDGIMLFRTILPKK
jgi:hypothetical protein